MAGYSRSYYGYEIASSLQGNIWAGGQRQLWLVPLALLLPLWVTEHIRDVLSLRMFKLRVKHLCGTVCKKLQVKFIRALTEGTLRNCYSHPGLGSLQMSDIIRG